ncbi:hypothetical protein BKA56DRAFT_610314 [Ilyonectria sp. MPI-CAGE-AT-0026]|nr:hypothetical protein BKA56DRAFT_610314 [Ilyonectria sp. MPI-CAGE-AT-0026]
MRDGHAAMAMRCRALPNHRWGILAGADQGEGEATRTQHDTRQENPWPTSIAGRLTMHCSAAAAAAAATASSCGRPVDASSLTIQAAAVVGDVMGPLSHRSSGPHPIRSHPQAVRNEMACSSASTASPTTVPLRKEIQVKSETNRASHPPSPSRQQTMRRYVESCFVHASSIPWKLSSIASMIRHRDAPPMDEHIQGFPFNLATSQPRAMEPRRYSALLCRFWLNFQGHDAPSLTALPRESHETSLCFSLTCSLVPPGTSSTGANHRGPASRRHAREARCSSCMRLILRLPINGMSPHYPGHEPGRNMQRQELQNRYLTQRPTQAWHLDFSQQIRYFDT